MEPSNASPPPVRLSNGVPVAGAIALVGYFMPWASVPILGSVSGSTLSEVAPLLNLIPLGAIAMLVAFGALTGAERLPLARTTAIAAGLIPLGALIYMALELFDRASAAVSTAGPFEQQLASSAIEQVMNSVGLGLPVVFFALMTGVIAALRSKA